MIHLRDLDPQLMRQVTRDGSLRWEPVETLALAQGLMFSCPKCHGQRGAHVLMCWSRSAGVPDDATPGPGRWRLGGTSLDNVSLLAEPGHKRAIVITGGCNWRGRVHNGWVE